MGSVPPLLSFLLMIAAGWVHRHQLIGLNLAVADVHVLAAALTERYTTGKDDALDRYSGAALERVWAAEHFSWWMTAMLHRFSDDDPFGRRMQLAQLRRVIGSTALQTALAEQYVGAPLPGSAAYRNMSPPSGRCRSLIDRADLPADSR